MAQIRLSSHPLNIEAQRGTIREPNERKCQVCNLNEAENEIHFLLQCPYYETERTEVRALLDENPNTRALNKTQSFIWLMSNENKRTCKIISKFMTEALNKRKEKLKA